MNRSSDLSLKRYQHPHSLEETTPSWTEHDDEDPNGFLIDEYGEPQEEDVDDSYSDEYGEPQEEEDVDDEIAIGINKSWNDRFKRLSKTKPPQPDSMTSHPEVAAPAPPTPENSDASPYVLVRDDPDPSRNGLFQIVKGRRHRLCRVAVRIRRQIQFGSEKTRVYEIELTFQGQTHIAELARDRFDAKLSGLIEDCFGLDAHVQANPKALANAVRAVSRDAPTVERLESFGWHGKVFHAPAGSVSRDGFLPRDRRTQIEVRYPGGHNAPPLDLVDPAMVDLPDLLRHLAEDLWGLQTPAVMASLLAAVALAPLRRHLDAPLPAVWLFGRTGTGKSTLARLAAAFFGDFSPDDGLHVGSWSSTDAAIREQGHRFSDALFVMDDFRPTSTERARVLKLLQAYADRASNGRMRGNQVRDLTTEGLLLCTGEAFPDVDESARARCIPIRVEARSPNPEALQRCRLRRREYPAILAILIQHVLQNGGLDRFRDTFASLRERYAQSIAGRPNQSRMATNMAQMGAALLTLAEALRPHWPGLTDQANDYVDRDLPAMLARQADAVDTKPPHEVFLDDVRDRIAHGTFLIEGTPAWHAIVEQSDGEEPLVAGRLLEANGQQYIILKHQEVYDHIRKNGSSDVSTYRRKLVRHIFDALHEHGQLIRPEDVGLSRAEKPLTTAQRIPRSSEPLKCIVVEAALLLFRPDVG